VKRISVTVTEELNRLLGESMLETTMRRAMEEWLAERGESPAALRSEGGRIRVLLQLGLEAARDRALDVGYRDMAVWFEETDHGRRAGRDASLRREAPRWTAHDEVAAGPKASTGS